MVVEDLAKGPKVDPSMSNCHVSTLNSDPYWPEYHHLERFLNDLGVSKYGFVYISAKPFPGSLTRVCVSAKALCVSFLVRLVALP